jgi:hypothetical protein
MGIAPVCTHIHTCTARPGFLSSRTDMPPCMHTHTSASVRPGFLCSRTHMPPYIVLVWCCKTRVFVLTNAHAPLYTQTHIRKRKTRVFVLTNAHAPLYCLCVHIATPLATCYSDQIPPRVCLLSSRTDMPGGTIYRHSGRSAMLLS